MLVDLDYDEDDGYDLEEAQSAKKARLFSDNTMDADAVYAPMPPTLSACPDLKHKSSTRSISSSLLNKDVDFAPTVDGYPGQFKALRAPSKVTSGMSSLCLTTFTILTTHPAKFIIPQREHRVTFGNEMHANGLFHNNRFQAGGNTSFNEYSLVFSQSTVPSANGPLGKALRIAEEKSEVAGDMMRTAEEEALRRETHFECSFARLQGVSVGEFRYFHGHSGIAEYSKGGFCVCWGECFCTAVCTKYADMVCPCAKHLEFEE
jgi:hypothetical protein